MFVYIIRLTLPVVGPCAWRCCTVLAKQLLEEVVDRFIK